MSLKNILVGSFVVKIYYQPLILLKECGKMKSIKLAILLTLGIISTYAQAGPFGLTTGQDISSIKKSKTQISDFHYFIDPPKKSSNFSHYVALFTEKHGLCAVTALKKNISTNSYGNELKTVFEDIKETLSIKYGEPDTVLDSLLDESIFDSPNHFMLGLIERERLLAAYWYNHEGIHAIGIEADAEFSYEGSIIIKFEFENIDRCRNFIKNRESEVF